MTQLGRLTNKQKAKYWKNPLSALPPMLDPEFRWMTMDNRILTVREMSTYHLFNSLKMIWNHTTPIQYRFLPYKPYKGIINWNPESRRRAIFCLSHELALRPDINATMLDVLGKMAHYVRSHGQQILHTRTKDFPKLTNGET